MTPLLSGYWNKQVNGESMSNNPLCINVFGDSIEAAAISSCLASDVKSVNLVSKNSSRLNKVLKSNHADHKLEVLYKEACNSGRLMVSSQKNENANIHWIVYKSKDYNEVKQLVDDILRTKVDKQYLILSSLLPIGTHDRLNFHISDKYKSGDCSSQHELITIPQFFREGNAVQDFFYPPSLLIGTKSESASEVVSRLLNKTIINSKNVFYMPGVNVEVVNNAVSAFLAMRVSFINELSTMLEARGIDYDMAMNAMSSDPRFGDLYNKAGCGFGGIALHESVINIQNLFHDLSAGSLMMQATLDINDSQKDILFRKFWQFYNTNIKGKKVVIWGAAFRANTSSIENSPSITLVEALLAESVTVTIYDPMANPSFANKFSNDNRVSVVENMYSALDQADALFIVTDWPEFKGAELKVIKSKLAVPVIFDGRNIYDPEIIKSEGIDYYGIGRNGLASKGESNE